MNKQVLVLSISALLLTGCSSSQKDKRFEIEKDIYLQCIDRTVNNWSNFDGNLTALETLSKAQIYCADLYPNALK
jgi:uncharacterized protein YcfL